MPPRVIMVSESGCPACSEAKSRVHDHIQHGEVEVREFDFDDPKLSAVFDSIDGLPLARQRKKLSEYDPVLGLALDCEEDTCGISFPTCVIDTGSGYRLCRDGEIPWETEVAKGIMVEED